MSIRRASSLQWLALASLLFALGCDDNNPATTVSSPTLTPGRAFNSAGMSITPNEIQPVVIVGAVCPGPRFVAPFTLGLAGNGDEGIVQSRTLDAQGFDPGPAVDQGLEQRLGAVGGQLEAPFAADILGRRRKCSAPRPVRHARP